MPNTKKKIKARPTKKGKAKTQKRRTTKKVMKKITTRTYTKENRVVKKEKTQESKKARQKRKELAPRVKKPRRARQIIVFITATTNITVTNYECKTPKKGKPSTKKSKPFIKKNDKSAAFLNTQQKKFWDKLDKFKNTLSRQKRKDFIAFVKAEAQANGGDKAVEKIGNEAMFMTYIKHLDRKDGITKRLIIGTQGDNIVVIKKFQQLYDLRSRARSTMKFYPVTNVTLYTFPKE